MTETTMDCEQAQNLISAELDGEATEAQRRTLEAHVAQCAPCRELASALAAQHAELRGAFVPGRGAAGRVAERVLEQMPVARQARRSWLPLFAAAAAGFLLAMLLLRPWERREPAVPVVATTLPSLTPVTAQPPVARLALATGKVEIISPGASDWQPMQTGGAVARNDRVRTGPGVCCEFHCPDGSEVRLNAGSELRFDSPRKLKLAAGRVWSSVAKAAEPFLVDFSEATVTAVGTQFDLMYTPGEATLTVVEGSTSVRDAAGEKLVHSGEALKIVNGKAGEPSRVNDLTVATNWVHEILVLKGRDDPELSARIDDLFAQIGQQKMSYMYEEEIRALGDHCVLPLTRYIESDRSRGQDAKRRNAARLLSDAAGAASVPDLVRLLDDRDGEVRYHAARALARLTGATYGCAPEQWRDESPANGAAAREQWARWPKGSAQTVPPSKSKG